jgi:hypothetical protein
MNSKLAEQLLVKIMKWSQEEVMQERPLIQALGSLKYDEYQQYAPGNRFTESLCNWLNRFETLSERKTAYEFVKSQLIFVTQDQMMHLISICFAECIDPILTNKAAAIMNILPYKVTKIHADPTYKELKRKSVFLGLSDGSKIDQLRRNSGLDNEQVFPSYQVSEDKIEDMRDELFEAIKKEEKFNSIFLIDDFTASGLSYCRPEEGKGKIFKFLDLLYMSKSDKHPIVLGDMIDINTLDLHIVFYIARRYSLDFIREEVEKWKVQNRKKFHCSVTAIQVIEERTAEQVLATEEIMKIVADPAYFDDTIINKAYRKGKTDKPFLGFDQCALPLILYHNTPNNSLPLLWLPDGKKFTGLFPRVTRH